MRFENLFFGLVVSVVCAYGFLYAIGLILTLAVMAIRVIISAATKVTCFLGSGEPTIDPEHRR